MAAAGGAKKTAGTAFVAVLPAFDKFDEGFKAGLRGIKPIEVPVTADTSKLEAALRSTNAPTIQVQTQADTSGLRSQVQNGPTPTIDVKAEVDEAGFKSQLGRLSDLAAGAGIGAGILGSLSGAMGQEDIAAKLQAQLGVTPEEATRLGKLAGSLYANNFGDSAGEVGDAVASTLQTTFGAALSPDQLESFTGQALNLAETFEQDYGGITRSVDQMLKTGMAGSAQDALDILQRGFQGGVNSADDLLDTFNEYGTQFRKLGIDGPTAMGLLQQGLQGGARDADLVADAFKEFSLRSIDGSKAVSDAYGTLGLDAQQMTQDIAGGGPAAAAATQQVLDALNGLADPAVKAATATALFGTQSEDLGAALGALNLPTASSQMSDFQGAAQSASDAVGGTASASIETFKRQLSSTFIETLGGTILPIINGAAGAVGGMSNLVRIATFAIIGLATAYTIMKVAQVASTIAQWAMNSALLASPLTWIILAIAAVVAGLVLAYQNVGWFRDLCDSVFGFVKDLIMGIVDAIKAVIEWAGNMGKALYDATHTVETKVDTSVDAQGNVVDNVTGEVVTRADGSSNPNYKGTKPESSGIIGWLADHTIGIGLARGGVTPAASGRMMPFSGVVPGWTPGRDTHLAAYGGGEGVLRPEATRVIGKGGIDSINAAARLGGASAAARAMAQMMGGASSVVPVPAGGGDSLSIGTVIGAREDVIASSIMTRQRNARAMRPMRPSIPVTAGR